MEPSINYTIFLANTHSPYIQCYQFCSQGVSSKPSLKNKQLNIGMTFDITHTILSSIVLFWVYSPLASKAGISFGLLQIFSTIQSSPTKPNTKKSYLRFLPDYIPAQNFSIGTSLHNNLNPYYLARNSRTCRN